MTAKEAAAASKKVATKVKHNKAFAAEEERLRKQKEEKYMREGAVDFILEQFHEEWLPKAIKGNRRSCNVSVCHNQITSDIAKERLIKDGFKVSPTAVEHYDSYSGSIDDGFAYAHDAYSEWTFTVSW